MHSAEAAADQLEETLNRIYICLRAGDFQAAAMLTEATEQGLTAIEGLSDPIRAEKLRTLAERNARCLKAAARGIRAARRRLAEVISARAGLQTYDGQGQTRQIAPRQGALRARF